MKLQKLRGKYLKAIVEKDVRRERKYYFKLLKKALNGNKYLTTK